MRDIIVKLKFLAAAQRFPQRSPREIQAFLFAIFISPLRL